MEKNLYFISSILSFAVFLAAFFVISRFLIKPGKKLQLLLVIISVVCCILISSVIWIYGYDFGPIQRGIISGLSGSIIGVIAGTIPRSTKNDADVRKNNID